MSGKMNRREFLKASALAAAALAADDKDDLEATMTVLDDPADLDAAISALTHAGINPVSQLDWSDHIPPDWPAKALIWMCGAEADPYLGDDISLRLPEIRAAVGLTA